MELSDIKGLGPAKQEALRAAGIDNVEDLAGLDLRRNVEVQGVTQEALKGLKQRARQALNAEGTPVPKAPYRRNGKAKPKATTRKTLMAVPESDPVVASAAKREFLRRILARRL